LEMYIVMFGDVYCDVWRCILWCLEMYIVMFGDVYCDVWRCILWCLEMYIVMFGDVYCDVWRCILWCLEMYIVMFGDVYWVVWRCILWCLFNTSWVYFESTLCRSVLMLIFVCWYRCIYMHCVLSVDTDVCRCIVSQCVDIGVSAYSVLIYMYLLHLHVLCRSVLI